MLPRSLVEEIDHLLQQGELSQRKIAARLGVSRGTVGAIASGRRGLFGRVPDRESLDPLAPLSPARRCAVCGFKVHKPCLVCCAREYRERRRRARLAAMNQDGRAVLHSLRDVRACPGPAPSRFRVA
jgi:transcriptional regulator with XRE-family HTH domain